MHATKLFLCNGELVRREDLNPEHRATRQLTIEEQQAVAEMYSSQYDSLHQLSEADVDAMAAAQAEPGEARQYRRGFPSSIHD